MMLAAIPNPLNEILDHPWRIGGRTIPWMSSQIAAMILVGAFLCVVLPLIARRFRGHVARGPCRILELLVLFVRNHIAAQAIGPEGRAYVPYLSTLLTFLLAVNLFGLMPLDELTRAIGLTNCPIGGTATGSIYVTGALAALTFAALLVAGYWRNVKILWKGTQGPPDDDKPPGRSRVELNLFLVLSNALQRRRWPLPVAAVAAVPVWLNGLVPPVPGIPGLVLWPVLLLLEIIGYVAKCVALAIRLFANMVDGHLMVAVMLLFATKAGGWAIAYVSLPTALAALAIITLDALVAVIQAYIFTFLTALYIGLAVYPRH